MSEAELFRLYSAQLVREMIDQKPWCNHLWARAALAIAARTIIRNRHRTAEEKLQNLLRAMEQDNALDESRCLSTHEEGLNTGDATQVGKHSEYPPGKIGRRSGSDQDRK